MSTISTQAAEGFLSFVNASPTPFHAVSNASRYLEKAGFRLIRERDSWHSTVRPGGKYFLTRNASTIVAFAVGARWRPGNPISMIGAHTDSPCLRVKPVSRKQGDGFLQVGVEAYGGGLWHTWFDRDLSLAGRAMVRGKDGTIQQKLVKIDRPILRIPTLAVHFERQETFAFNKESQLFPICGLVAAELNRVGAPEKGVDKLDVKDDESSTQGPIKAMQERHHPFILETIAKAAGVEVDAVEDFEMLLYDTQKSCIGGLNDELIFSARLDNLMMTYCGVRGLIESVSSSAALDEDGTIRLVSCFDHEEIGSLTAQGADSNMLPTVVSRLATILGASAASVLTPDNESDASYDKLQGEDRGALEQTLARSFLISADMAHSVNPNYSAKYEADHRPEMNKGTVIKINANARYATNSPGIVLLQESARLAKPSTTLRASPKTAGVPLQLFVVRNDSLCGGTIGPMLSAKLGVRTLDLGNAQLSMHSIRECCGAFDVEHSINLFDSFYRNYEDLEAKITVD